VKDFILANMPVMLWVGVGGLGLGFIVRAFKVLALGRMEVVRRLTQKWTLDAAGIAPVLGVVWLLNGLFLAGAAAVMASQALSLSQWAPWVLGVQAGFFMLNEVVLQWHRRQTQRIL
jgi:hypothetical protein